MSLQFYIAIIVSIIFYTYKKYAPNSLQFKDMSQFYVQTLR